jgi:hypothetical protein
VSRKELETILDYILNTSDAAEFEVIRKACERRSRDISAFASLGGKGPGTMAKDMAGELQKTFGATMESVRATVKGFIEDIVRKNAPDVTEEQLAALLEEYLPERGAGGTDATGSGGGKLLGDGAAYPAGITDATGSEPGSGAPQGIPKEALLAMVLSFVEYSRGAMAPSRQQELWESNRRWQEEYWAAFPPEIKAIVKAYIEGRIEGEAFGSALLSILGL